MANGPSSSLGRPRVLGPRALPEPPLTRIRMNRGLGSVSGKRSFGLGFMPSAKEDPATPPGRD